MADENNDNAPTLDLDALLPVAHEPTDPTPVADTAASPSRRAPSRPVAEPVDRLEDASLRQAEVAFDRLGPSLRRRPLRQAQGPNPPPNRLRSPR